MLCQMSQIYLFILTRFVRIDKSCVDIVKLQFLAGRTYRRSKNVREKVLNIGNMS